MKSQSNADVATPRPRSRRSMTGSPSLFGRAGADKQGYLRSVDGVHLSRMPGLSMEWSNEIMGAQEMITTLR